MALILIMHIKIDIDENTFSPFSLQLYNDNYIKSSRLLLKKCITAGTHANLKRELIAKLPFAIP